MANNHYTTEQVEWLKKNFHSAGSYKELAEWFNSQFHATRTPEQLSDKCSKNLRLKGMPNSTRYGNKPKEELPIGSIRKTQNRTYIKVEMLNEPVHISGYTEPYWLPLQKKIYQDNFGKIGDSEMICFLDGNPDNFNVDNLYCINRKISMMMTTNKWWTNSREHTLTAIRICELYFALKEARR